MLIDEYRPFILALCDLETEELKKIGYHFKCVFLSDEDAPSEELLRKKKEIDNGVKNYFPSKFAEKYEAWSQKIVAFQFSIESHKDVSEQFLDMFLRLKGMWSMLLELLPFLLMLSVNRMNKDRILSVGKEEFEKAFSIYKTIYHGSNKRGIESYQCQLTIYLFQLFRKLYSHHAIGNEFIFQPLLKEGKDFNNLFPIRIDAIFLLFSYFDEITIKRILTENDTNILKNISFLLNWALLDILVTIMPISKNFYLAYIISIDLDDSPPKAKGISISGIGNPENVNFRILKGHLSDSNRLQKSNLYLINREKQIDFQEFGPIKKYLTPDDYMNLTPLMLYTTFKELGDKKNRNSNTENHEQKELFVFYGYDSREKFLRFLEFSGGRVAEIIKSEKSGYYKLFEEYEAFSKNLNEYYGDNGKSINKIAIDSDINKTDANNLIFTKTWEISKGHISSLLMGDEYDSEALLKNYIPDSKKNAKFIEEVFVSPKEEILLEEFIISEKRGLILVGKSGIGKSNLLCSFFLKQRRRKQLTIFIDARKLNNKNIRHFLKESVIERINEVWGLKEFDNYLQLIQDYILIVIDGINEYNNSGGALGLLEEVCNFIEDPNIFKNAKIVASCRIEMWNQYKEKNENARNILNDEYFFTVFGDAVIVSGFEGDDERSSLYAAYVNYYKLKPLSFKSLSQPVKELIRQPFMMGLIAEIYSNKKIDSFKENTIPKKLDFFLLFKLLTERKKNDAKRLFNLSSLKQDSFGKDYEKCLFSFAKILYKRIIDADVPGKNIENIDWDDKSDSLPIDLLDKDKDFSSFFDTISTSNSTSIFSSIIQVGLIEKLYIYEYDYWGNKKSGRAYKFFHDQYTQYWLSAVYSNSNILGNISSSELRSDKNVLAAIRHKVVYIIERSKNAPVLFGGLYHWLYNNMCKEKKEINDFLTVLFNELVKNDSNIVNYFVGSYLHWLIDANIVTSKKLHNELIKNGDIRLRKCFYEHIIHIWPDISSDTFQTILAGENDKTLIRGISDIFVNLFTLEPTEVINFLDKELNSFEKFSLEILAKGLFDKTKLIKGFTFAQMFITSSLLCNFSDSGKLSYIRNFLKKKYNLIIDIITDKSATGIKGLTRDKMYRVMEDSGTYQWNQAIGSQGGNNTFFIKDDGLIQREILYNFYKYCVYFHNGEMEKLSLDKCSEYMVMTLKMIEYRHSSVIGYVATLILAGVLKGHMEKIIEIIDEILKINSKGAIFYGIILLRTLAILKESSIEIILDIIHKKFIPRMIGDFKKDEYTLTLFFIIGSVNFDKHWEKCENIFSDIIDQLRRKDDAKCIENFGHILIECLFLPDVKIGEKICDYLLNKNLHTDQFWREFTFKMLASMLARSPKILKRILDKHMIKDITSEVRIYLTEDIIKVRSQVSYKDSWNNFFILGLFNNKKLRYLLIKNFLAGLVQSNCVEEFVKEFRRLVVEGVRAFIINDKDFYYEHLTVEEALSSTECHWKEVD